MSFLLEAYFSLFLFSFVLLGSPGPAPLAIAATGAVFGIRLGLRFVLGLLVGFALVLVIQGTGMLLVLDENRELLVTLQVFGFFYILFVAYKIVAAPLMFDESPEASSPPGFIDGFILNLSNPKAYAAMTVINVQVLLPYPEPKWAYLMTALVCFLVVVVIDLLWLFLGQLLRPWMQQPKTAKKVRITFAIMMVAVVFLLLIKNS